MRIVNSNATTVPFGKYSGFDLQELVEIDPDYARWLLNETELRSAYPDHYYDLEVYLASTSLYRRAGLRAPGSKRRH